MAGAFEFAFSLASNDITPAIRDYPVAASQSLREGDPVKLVSGQVVKGGDGFGRCLGVMAHDSINATANTRVRVRMALSFQIWRAKSTADASALANNGTRTYDLNASLQVNTADTTGGCIQIVGISGPTNTDVYVAFTTTEF